MGRLQSTVGLVTGLDIQGTVEQLIKIQARPRDLTVSRNKDLTNQQLAVNELTASAITLQLAARNLGGSAIFNKKTVASSNITALTASLSGDPPVGSHQFTPIRRAQAHQVLSTGFATRDEPLGAGSFSFGFGGFIDKGVALEELNDGHGVQRGKIRITDRSGDSAVVDLRYAQTVDDVLEAINNADGVDVEVVAVGDALKLIDKTGGAGSLKVEEVSGGSTAADLGLGGVNVAADEAVGGDLLRLYNGLSIAKLNDGNGVDLNKAVPDLDIKFSDGTSLLVDFQRAAKDAVAAVATTNAAGGANAIVKLTADEPGAAANGVKISFVDDAGVTKGGETVVYDDTDPQNKTLVVHIQAGQSTANDVIAAINADATVGPLFTASEAPGATGEGVVSVSDQGTTSGGADAIAATNEKTLGDLLATLNAANPAKLQAAISAAGDTIELTDLTGGAGTFEVQGFASDDIVRQLGLDTTASGGVLTSRPLRGGLKSPLLSSLKGGQGFEGGLGQLELTDRGGATATVDLSTAQTLDDVLAAINAAGVGIKASVNKSRNGIKLEDTTGSLAGNLIVADGGDSLESATKLGLEVDDAVNKVDSGSLDLQYVNRRTRLDQYNGGIAKGSIAIRDANGSLASVKVDDAVETIGDLIDAINNLTIDVEARINDRGDGIVLIDTSDDGEETLEVRDVSGGTTALDLRIRATGVEKEVDGETKQVIEGASGYTVAIEEGDTLEDLVSNLNALGAPVSASILSDGSGTTPHHISLVSGKAGKAGELLIDTSQVGFSFNEVTKARDALLVIGGDGDGTGVLVSSSDNKFNDVLPGVNLVVADSTTSPVTVTISKTNSSVTTNVQLFVDSYNKLAKKIEDLTFYNETDNKTGVLFGSVETLRVESEVSNLLSGRFFGVGPYKSLQELGISFNDDGTLSFDSSKLDAKLASDPEGVETFFTDEKLGFAKKVDDLLESLAGRDNSLLTNRNLSLQRRIELNEERIEFYNARLSRQSELLLTQFYNMEIAIGKIQSNLTYIDQIQAVPSLIS
ncbi:MAG: flagellar filament capping protein FliD [Pirellulaceae bacterium]